MKDFYTIWKSAPYFPILGIVETENFGCFCNFQDACRLLRQSVYMYTRITYLIQVNKNVTSYEFKASVRQTGLTIDLRFTYTLTTL